jgi:type 1 glutamine amidotransferase
MKTLFSTFPFASFIVLGALGALGAQPARGAEPGKPLKALMIVGGCCHDYKSQKNIVAEALSKQFPIEWTVIHDRKAAGADAAGDVSGAQSFVDSRDHVCSVYGKDDWAKGYDVVVHNECFGAVKDPAVVARIARAHKEGGVPAVFLHCAMHSYRMAENADAWREVVGAKSTYHEAQAVLEVKAVDSKHPVMRGFPAQWTTPAKDELYVVEKLWDTATVLGTSYSEKLHRDNPVIWVNQIGPVRTFATSLGHPNATMEAAEYLQLVGRGLLWVCGRLTADTQPAGR